MPEKKWKRTVNKHAAKSFGRNGVTGREEGRIAGRDPSGMRRVREERGLPRRWRKWSPQKMKKEYIIEVPPIQRATMNAVTSSIGRVAKEGDKRRQKCNSL
jgi:hypothetical protein